MDMDDEEEEWLGTGAAAPPPVVVKPSGLRRGVNGSASRSSSATNRSRPTPAASRKQAALDAGLEIETNALEDLEFEDRNVERPITPTSGKGSSKRKKWEVRRQHAQLDFVFLTLATIGSDHRRDTCAEEDASAPHAIVLHLGCSSHIEAATGRYDGRHQCTSACTLLERHSRRPGCCRVALTLSQIHVLSKDAPVRHSQSFCRILGVCEGQQDHPFAFYNGSARGVSTQVVFTRPQGPAPGDANCMDRQACPVLQDIHRRA
jgi:hypothetical protein